MHFCQRDNCPVCIFKRNLPNVVYLSLSDTPRTFYLLRIIYHPIFLSVRGQSSNDNRNTDNILSNMEIKKNVYLYLPNVPMLL